MCVATPLLYHARDHGHKQTRAHYDETQPLTAGPTSVKPPAAALLTSLLTTP